MFRFRRARRAAGPRDEKVSSSTARANAPAADGRGASPDPGADHDTGSDPAPLPEPGPPPAAHAQSPRAGVFGRLRRALSRTRSGLVDRLAELFARTTALDDRVLEDIETILLSADLGIAATDRILSDLARRLERERLDEPRATLEALRASMLEVLEPAAEPLHIETSQTPYVILVVGVNGAGKTTTIAKLAQRLRSEGRSVMLAAGDTFRAAAIEQLQAWGSRLAIPVIAQQPGADSASVAYDALAAATARKIDILIIDTAGRLHTQVGLMEELKKVRRVVGKLDPRAPHETLLVLDAGTGQNALVQAEQFRDAVAVSGIALTKLDGTAKGGVIFSVAAQLRIPIRLIGVGESAEDLRDFDAAQFIDALLDIPLCNGEG